MTADSLERVTGEMERWAALLRLTAVALDHGDGPDTQVTLEIHGLTRAAFDRQHGETRHFPPCADLEEFWVRTVPLGKRVKALLFTTEPPWAPASVFLDDFFSDEDGLTRRQREMA